MKKHWHTLAALLMPVVAMTPQVGQAQLTAIAVVVPGYTMAFPRDFGSHPEYHTEWWYLTGWLTTDGGETLGFQVTFFRTRPVISDANPSAFAPRQLLIAHCALSDPARGRLWQDQRIRRAGLGLAEAEQADTNVWIDDWQLKRAGSGYHTKITAGDFALDLSLLGTQPPMLNGAAGFSRKGPASASASYYYSEPHLQVSGRIARAGKGDAVRGEAWLDHEWSSDYLEPQAAGWDWVGLNLRDGGALMAFRIRDRQGQPLWAGGTLRNADGQVRVFGRQKVAFIAGRNWRSSRTGVRYPVTWQLRLAERVLDIEPLMDDQENDARASSAAIYWEGAIRAEEGHHLLGRGYLELTGYGEPLQLR